VSDIHPFLSRDLGVLPGVGLASSRRPNQPKVYLKYRTLADSDSYSLGLLGFHPFTDGSQQGGAIFAMFGPDNAIL